MALSHDLISQFAKLAAPAKKTTSETTVYGVVKEDANGNKYVKLDGTEQIVELPDGGTNVVELSDINQPSLDVSSADVNVGDRVSVQIKNHTASVSGNTSSPAARTDDLKATTDDLKATKLLIADEATIGKLQAAEINVVKLLADEASIEKLLADQITVSDLVADRINADIVNAKYVNVDELNATQAEIEKLIADEATIKELKASNATIYALIAKKADIESLKSEYADIGFANIGSAAIDNFYTKSGIIEKETVDEGIILRLKSVHINADDIDVGTLNAERINVKGDDGLYYRLNVDALGNTSGEELSEEEQEKLKEGIHGKNIIAESIAAEDIAVSDLVAFDATIGGLKLKDGSIYSSAKGSVDNTSKGIYIDANGQFAVGNKDDFIKFHATGNGYVLKRLYNDEDGVWENVTLAVECDEAGNVISINGVGVSEIVTFPDADFEKGPYQSDVHQVTLVDGSTVYYSMFAIYDDNGDIEMGPFYYELEVVPGDYKLEISAGSIAFSNGGNVEDTFEETNKKIDSVKDDLGKTINENRAENEDFKTEFSKYIRFLENDTGIVIGSGDSAITLEIDNETGIIFKKNGVEFGKWDGQDFYTGNIVVETTEQARFGNFAYVPREDGSLSFFKVGG